MGRSNESMAWYNALPKEKQQLLDLWEEHDLNWNGPAWDDEPESVELEGYTNGGEDMIINLHDISANDLQEYVSDFDINENVAMWWPDGQPGRGVPFDTQAEQVEDYEEWLAELQDIIDESRGTAFDDELTSVQKLAADRFRKALKELRSLDVGIRYDADTDEFELYRKAA